MNASDNTASEARYDTILDSAKTAFLAYGFSRTTMDDIARAAKLSRPALYLHFKNKTAIYRAIAKRMLLDSVAIAGEELNSDGTFEQKLFRAIDGALLTHMAEIMQAPHGSELLDAKNDLAADLLGEWQVEMTKLFATFIDAEANRSGTDLESRNLSAGELAETLMDGLEGMKMRLQEAGQQASATRSIVRLIALAVTSSNGS